MLSAVALSALYEIVGEAELAVYDPGAGRQQWRLHQIHSFTGATKSR
jgi:hypothetical protein